MLRTSALLLLLLTIGLLAGNSQTASAPSSDIIGFMHPAEERAIESRFIAVPDPKLAREHLRILTQAPHVAGTPEDKTTADYVAQKFREAGLQTEIVEYKVWMSYPSEISVDVTAPGDVHMHGPTREHVDGDPYDSDPRVIVPFTGMSPSGDAEAEVVYANYGSPADFEKLEEMKIDVRGKIVIARYGQNYRGVKADLAHQHGAAGLILYSDPADDGAARGPVYPNGPWRPATAVQRGAINAIWEFPGDVTTPGVASLPSLPDSKRVSPEDSAAMAKILSTPISSADAAPILQHLAGPAAPKNWNGGLSFDYHIGPGPVRVKLHLKQDFQFRTIWDVIGTVPGSERTDEIVVAGNHRDAWVYGAVDPNSGTAAMLEAARGMGELLKSGWKPRRTIVLGSWDAEEEGLMGSTEWGEQHPDLQQKAVAYFNTDMAVSGPAFGAAAVPSLKRYVREITKAVPDPSGGTVYENWKKQSAAAALKSDGRETSTSTYRAPLASSNDVPVSDLGSGSDFSVFLQHLGIASTDVGSVGDYGVYHSVFDNFAWFTKFGDPTFAHEQKMARIFGLEVIRMADADVLPYDFAQYGKEIGEYIANAQKRAATVFTGHPLDFEPALQSARRLAAAGTRVSALQASPSENENLNAALIQADRALLLKDGVPGRPWFRHAIYAPGKHAGYAAAVIPGVNDSIDEKNLPELQNQLNALASSVNNAAAILEAASNNR